MELTTLVAPTAASYAAVQLDRAKAQAARYTEDAEGNIVLGAPVAQVEYSASIHKIPTTNLGKLEEALAKLAKKAKKLGTAAPVVTLGEVVTETVCTIVPDWDDAQGCEVGREVRRSVSFQFITVEGQTPKVDGWSFVCALEHTPEGNLVTSAPGKTAPEGAQTLKAGCAHCRVNTRRKDTFILVNEAGVQKQVGRNCLADFLGGQSPEHLIAGVESLRDLFKALGECEEEGGFGGKPRDIFALSDFLAYVAHFIQKDGWVSKAVARDYDKVSTASAAWDCWMETLYGQKPNRKYHPTQAEFDLGAVAAAWALTLTGSSDYEHNIRLIAKLGTITSKHAGFAASIVSGYQKSLVDAKEKAAKATAKPSEFVGKVGDKIDVKVLVLARIPIESQWGSSDIYLLKGEDGNIYKWKASGGDSADKGEEVTFRATIKEHAVYKDTKQTVVTRGSFWTAEQLEYAQKLEELNAAAKVQRAAEAKAAKLAAKQATQTQAGV